MANGGQVDIFGEYVRRRLEAWGHEFALHRDCEYLGHQSENMLYHYWRHEGQMPAKATGYKPLEVDPLALEVERIVTDVARENPVVACVLRGYYCGQGRRKVERWQTANELIQKLKKRPISDRHYINLHHVGFDMVRDRISC